MCVRTSSLTIGKKDKDSEYPHLANVVTSENYNQLAMHYCYSNLK